MSNQIELTQEQLERFFTTISTNDFKLVQTMLYKHCFPYVDIFAAKYKLPKKMVEEIYEDVFINIYIRIKEGALVPDEFSLVFEEEMTKGCRKAKMESFILPLKSLSNKVYEEEDDFAAKSLLYIAQMLQKMSENPEIASENGIRSSTVEIIKDFFGFNKEKTRLTEQEIADKYGISLKKTNRILGQGILAVRKMELFDPIKRELRKR